MCKIHLMQLFPKSQKLPYKGPDVSTNWLPLIEFVAFPNSNELIAIEPDSAIAIPNSTLDVIINKIPLWKRTKLFLNKYSFACNVIIENSLKSNRQHWYHNWYQNHIAKRNQTLVSVPDTETWFCRTLQWILLHTYRVEQSFFGIFNTFIHIFLIIYATTNFFKLNNHSRPLIFRDIK